MLIGALFIYLSKRKKESQSRLAMTKKRPVNEIRAGEQVEVQGLARADHPLITPFSKQECVYYEYNLEKEVEERDKEGRISHNWENVKSGDEKIDFYLEDGTGQVKIINDKARIEARDLGERFIEPGESLDDSIIGKIFNFISDSRYRAEEKGLLSGMQVYICGQATQTNEGLAIQKGEGEFIISYRSEEEVEKSMGRSATLLKVLGYLGVVGGAILAVYSFFG